LWEHKGALLLSVGEQKVTKESLTRLREKILAYAKSSVRRLLFYEGPFKSCFLLQFGAVQLSICFSLRIRSAALAVKYRCSFLPKNISASAQQAAAKASPYKKERALRLFLFLQKSYFLFFSKCAFVSLNTTGLSAISAIRLGSAIRPLRVSAMSHASWSFMVVPTIMNRQKMT